MRFLMPVCVFLAVAGLHTAFTASLESAEKEETVAEETSELSELQKTDQMEFEAAEMNDPHRFPSPFTEEKTQDARYLEAAKDQSEEEQTEVENENAEGDGKSDVAANDDPESDSLEETDGVRQKREHHDSETDSLSNSDDLSEDTTKEQGAQGISKDHGSSS
ncbi:glutamic acid-rich protein isoform X1 [Lampris incognitus]|uniref:glutamic acid-rich protein isoform X1 n=1 Tax=Lampris incognitus TaxID=2546036 RepID=UPI0024B59C53|nr:glutamic acid-rich protein isoform X1 [Lampris incognitus]